MGSRLSTNSGDSTRHSLSKSHDRGVTATVNVNNTTDICDLLLPNSLLRPCKINLSVFTADVPGFWSCNVSLQLWKFGLFINR
jgi:hypothetical protein